MKLIICHVMMNTFYVLHYALPIRIKICLKDIKTINLMDERINFVESVSCKHPRAKRTGKGHIPWQPTSLFNVQPSSHTPVASLPPPHPHLPVCVFLCGILAFHPNLTSPGTWVSLISRIWMSVFVTFLLRGDDLN